MPEIQAHVTMCLVAQARPCMNYVIGADGGAAELDVMTGSLKLTNHRKQVAADLLLHRSLSADRNTAPLAKFRHMGADWSVSQLCRCVLGACH